MLNKKPTKFICLVHYLCKEVYIQNEQGSYITIPENMIVDDEDGEIMIAECRNEKFDDNLVKVYFHDSQNTEYVLYDSLLVDIHGTQI